jgi:hypothetical protein
MQLQTLIAAVRRRWFVTVALRTAGASMAAAAVPLLAGLVVYWLIAPVGGALLMLAAFSTLLSIAAAGILVSRIEPRPDDTHVARFIEERAELLPAHLSMDDAVVSAVQALNADATDGRAPFASLVVASALRKLEGIDAAVLVPPSAVRRAALIALSGAAAVVITVAIGAPALRHALETARLRLFPASVSVEVVPGDTRIVAGRPLTIRARLRSGDALLSRAIPKLVVSAGTEERTVEMLRGGEMFEFPLESVDRTFKYKVIAGGVSSNQYTVTAMFPPRVKRIDVHYQYPSFSALAPRTEEDGGDIYAPAGTRITLQIHTDKPVVSGTLGVLKGSPNLRPSGDRRLEAELVIARDDSYRIHLLDGDGLESNDDSEYFIRVMEDRPPDVRILRPSADQGITPLQEVGIEARAEDDYGIASLDLVYSVAGGKERVVPFAKTAGGHTDRTGAFLLAAEELNVRPGDVITYYAKARDVARGRRSTEAKSDMFFLEVKPFNEEFVAAQSQAGGAGGGDPQIDALIQAQKDIISATWNVERRSAGGRSADDVKAIAKAQADLKERVERTLAGRSRRGRGFMMERQLPAPPQQQRQQTAQQADPIAAAVEAMMKAIEQLASEKTREAIPHEMTALNGLVQAQAEVRRRQITQQARGGSGGGNRQSQDLSALFDKELQRQQRTNYEQRSQVEERDDQQQSNQDTLDRIKDLARRQEELSRQQRELAKMQAEARKRELERLAREQQDLQRQAEELSKQLQQQRTGQGQQSGQQQSGQQQSGQQQSGQNQSGQQSGGQENSGMRSALEQMRRAANDMRRDDAASAAQNGDRAAEQLRQLEQQMRGGSADARQRAAADLQAEAQQIAQEQRRIAAEADRMEKSGAADADARRRLAGDKDRLSDRVDNMKRDAERLGNEKGKGDESSRAREAAGALDKQQIGERMRQTAQSMRDGAKPSGEAEQQVAKALDQVVDTLGGTASADAQKLADQLDQSRQTRERLDQLEAQMRQAEGRKDGEFDKLRQQYQNELARARETLGRQPGQEQRDGSRGSTPEQQEFSRSAPGTEAFKQDRAKWQSLRKDVDRALEEQDAAVSRRLAKALGEDRLNAGGSDRVPEQYRQLVAKYYESLARVKK